MAVSGQDPLTWDRVRDAADRAGIRANEFQVPTNGFQCLLARQLTIDLIILEQVRVVGNDGLRGFFIGLHHALGDRTRDPRPRKHWRPEFKLVMETFRLILEAEASSSTFEQSFALRHFKALVPGFCVHDFRESSHEVSRRIYSDFLFPPKSAKYFLLPEAGDFAVQVLMNGRRSKANLSVFVALIEYAVSELGEELLNLGDADGLLPDGLDESGKCQYLLKKFPICDNMTIGGGAEGRENYLLQYIRAQFRLSDYLRNQIGMSWQRDVRDIGVLAGRTCRHHGETHLMVEAIRGMAEIPPGLHYKSVEYFLGHYRKHRDQANGDNGRIYSTMEEYVTQCNQIISNWDGASLGRGQENQGRSFEYFRLKQRQKYVAVVGESNVNKSTIECKVFIVTCRRNDVKTK